jgi:hypothetical protein
MKKMIVFYLKRLLEKKYKEENKGKKRIFHKRKFFSFFLLFSLSLYF